MGASSYQRDRKRIYEESANRGKGFRKAALKRLDREYDVEPIRRGGKIVGVRFEDDSVMCKKKAFATREVAMDSLAQIARFQGAGHAKPQRIYHCPHCSKFHLTKLTSPGQPADIDFDD